MNIIQKKLSLLVLVGVAGMNSALLTGCEDPKAVLDAVDPPNSAPVPTPSSAPVTPPTPSPSPTTSPRPSPSPTTSPRPSPSPSPTSTPVSLYTGPKSVEKYVVKFIDDAKAQGVNVLPYMRRPKLEIRIASLDAWGTSVIGLCQSSSTLRRVTLDPDWWNRASETRRELLFHHELGHCVLDRRHRSTKLSSGAYASIMYPIIMSSTMYRNNYRYYQDELFSTAWIGWAARSNALAATTDEEHNDICGGAESEDDAETLELQELEAAERAEAISDRSNVEQTEVITQ